MQHSCLNFLCLTDIPEILTKITTGSSCYIHLRMVFIAALRAFPFIIIINDNLTVKATYMTVVRLGVELSILYVVVYISYDLCQSIQVVAHVWYLDI